MKITSFLTVHRLQHMMIIISIKKLALICNLKLSNLLKGSGALLTVRPIRLQLALAKSHSRKRWSTVSSVFRGHNTQLKKATCMLFLLKI